MRPEIVSVTGALFASYLVLTQVQLRVSQVAYSLRFPRKRNILKFSKHFTLTFEISMGLYLIHFRTRGVAVFFFQARSHGSVTSYSPSQVTLPERLSIVAEVNGAEFLISTFVTKGRVLVSITFSSKGSMFNTL